MKNIIFKYFKFSKYKILSNKVKNYSNVIMKIHYYNSTNLKITQKYA